MHVDASLVRYIGLNNSCLLFEAKLIGFRVEFTKKFSELNNTLANAVTQLQPPTDVDCSVVKNSCLDRLIVGDDQTAMDFLD